MSEPRAEARHIGKTVFFAVVGLMTLFVLWNNERFFLNAHAPEWKHFGPIRWHLLPHGIGGALALSLGAIQFSSRIRARAPRLHRVAGKLYIIGAFIAGPVAIRMAFINSPWFLIPFTVLQVVLWLLFTGFAYLSARRRDFTSHRAWMVRSYGIVLIFLEGRVLMAIPALARQAMDSIVLVNWLCLAATLAAADIILDWPRLRAGFSARRKSLT